MLFRKYTIIRTTAPCNSASRRCSPAGASLPQQKEDPEHTSQDHQPGDQAALKQKLHIAVVDGAHQTVACTITESRTATCCSRAGCGRRCCQMPVRPERPDFRPRSLVFNDRKSIQKTSAMWPMRLCCSRNDAASGIRIRKTMMWSCRTRIFAASRRPAHQDQHRPSGDEHGRKAAARAGQEDDAERRDRKSNQRSLPPPAFSSIARQTMTGTKPARIKLIGWDAREYRR